VAFPPGLIAGFDAGQTHTTCRLAEADSGRVLAEGQGPGVSHLACADGPARFQAALRISLAAARRQGGAIQATAADAAAAPLSAAAAATLAADRELPLLAAAIGASGIETGSAVERQGLALAAAALGLPAARLWLGGDERTALRGAFPDRAGIVVISGTGTIAVGRSGEAAAGREHRCSGWGWILDGAGSAFDIGRDGLALSLQMADGRLPDGRLRQALWRALALDPADPEAPQAIKALVVRTGFSPSGVAQLAPVVEALAQEADPQAVAILRRHAEALVLSVAGVARALQLSAPPVATLGGAILHLRCFRALFGAALQQALPHAGLVPAAGDAASGALALAREQLMGPPPAAGA